MSRRSGAPTLTARQEPFGRRIVHGNDGSAVTWSDIQCSPDGNLLLLAVGTSDVNGRGGTLYTSADGGSVNSTVRWRQLEEVSAAGLREAEAAAEPAPLCRCATGPP